MIPKTLFVTNRSNIRYLSGFSGSHGYVVLHNKKKYLLTDARYHIVAKNILPKGWTMVDITNGLEEPWRALLKKNRIKKVGFEGNNITLKFYNFLKKNSPGAKLIDIGSHVEEKRIIKSKEEISKIAKAQQITDAIYDILKRWLKPGHSETDIAWKIESLAHELGADTISFPPIIGINEHSAAPHHQNTDRKLKKGDLILVDMGVIYKGYCSDMTRMIFTKIPTNEEEYIYNLVWDAQEAAIKELKGGVRGDKIDKIARNYIKAAGYGEHFGHSLGHGVGLDIHELPNLSKKYIGKIPHNTIVTVEPGVYLKGKFGVRLEDMVQVLHGGVKNLTATRKELKSCTIKI